MRRRRPKGMTKEEAIRRIKDIEEPEFAGHAETYDLAVRAMNEFPDDHEVQSKGQWAIALGAITQARFIVTAGGVERTIKAMERFPMDERLQADGCETLRLLCSKQEGMRRTLQGGGLKVVCLALAQHSENVRLQQEAVGALTKFTSKDPKAVLAQGGFESIMHVMEMFPKYSWVQMWACQSITEFSKLDPKRVEGMDGYTKVEEVMKKFTVEEGKKMWDKSEAVQYFGRNALMTKPVP
mmetsp:Transcript_48265/g.121560  ORF Transcript_48265/g.121560 Transcript_48265/m.121560 type:complete len:239 (+) Transcript_48265:133-849(+)